MTIKIPYVTFMKHAQKVAKSATSKSRPVLGGVMHKEGSLTVTDSHRLYIATDAYTGEDKLEHPKTGKLIEGNYPDTSRLIPDPNNSKYSAAIKVDTAARITKLIEQAGKIEKATDLIEIELGLGGLVLAAHGDSVVNCRYLVEGLDGSEPFMMAASAKYVAEAFALLKDAGLEEVTFNFFGVNHPFTFTGGNLTALILPVRRN